MELDVQLTRALFRPDLDRSAFDVVVDGELREPVGATETEETLVLVDAATRGRQGVRCPAPFATRCRPRQAAGCTDPRPMSSDVRYRPRSPAVVGASRSRFVGRIALGNCRALGYTGRLVAITPAHREA